MPNLITPTAPPARASGETRQRRDWDTLARLDPFWAILSLPGTRFGRWDLDEFLATGSAQVRHHLDRGRRLGYPRRWQSVLDFGCGVGRLAPALAESFPRYVGVDVSPEMVDRARRLHAARVGCSFQTITAGGAPPFPEGSFDLVLSFYVLQHVASRAEIVACLGHLATMLRPGGLLVVQLPERIPAAEKLLYDGRRALHAGLRALGIPPGVLHQRLHLSPMAMSCVPEDDVVGVLAERGTMVLDREATMGGLAIHDRTYYAAKITP